MKTILEFKKQFLLLFIFSLISCSKENPKTPELPTTNYNISCKVNGTLWQSSTGSGAINDASGNPNAFLLLGGIKEGSQSSGTEFNIMLQKVNIVTGKTTIIKGGFNGGEFIGLNYNNKDYITNNGTENTELGAITILSIGANLTGTFNGELYAESGEIITITEGTFSVPLTHF